LSKIPEGILESFQHFLRANPRRVTYFVHACPLMGGHLALAQHGDPFCPASVHPGSFIV
jgi:hypothetical protein